MYNDSDRREHVISLMRQQKFEDALLLLRELFINNVTDEGLLYMAGQCCRFLGDFKEAVNYFKSAISINSKEPAFFLALGIAQQLTHEFYDAIEAFRKGIEIDPDLALAYNSLALTQKKMGDFEHALHNYDAGVKALTRRIVKNMNNTRSNKIFKHRESRHSL
jgi:tetratricopeptide (TPR) repeat protein